jgi:hypothetical protein
MFFSDLAGAGPTRATSTVGRSDVVDPAEVTRRHLDKSDVVATVLRTTWGAAEATALVGEMQMAFVSFLMGQSLASFEHWKALVLHLCACPQLMPSQAPLFSAFTRALAAQLQELPEDFAVDTISSQSFLRRALRDYFAHVDAAEAVAAAVMADTRRLKALVGRLFGWTNFEEDVVFDPAKGAFVPAFDDDDEAPVIVMDY